MWSENPTKLTYAPAEGDDGSHAVSKLVAVDAGCGPGSSASWGFEG